MKKNMVKVALVAVVGLIAGINMLNAQKSDVLSDVAMANVEALANWEDYDLRRGYILVIKSETCSVCEWTSEDEDYCDVHAQLPYC